MTWLARAVINAQTAFSNGMFDTYSWHQKIWDCFPDLRDGKRDFLTRLDVLEGAFQLWILAPRPPVCPSWCTPENFSIKEIASSFLSHQFYCFDLRANPTKCVKNPGLKGKTSSRGRRVVLTSVNDLSNWIIRKATTGGFRIVEEMPLEIGPVVENHFRKKHHQGFHGGVQFRGTLKVTDRAEFKKTYTAGIGSAKGFGFGMLLLAPANI